MITANDIMAGKLPATKRIFNVQGVGEIELHRLPAADEFAAKKLLEDQEADTEELEKVAQRNVYYLLHGKFDDEEAAKLPSLLDTSQLAQIYTTGLFFTDLSQSSLEQTEKN